MAATTAAANAAHEHETCSSSAGRRRKPRQSEPFLDVIGQHREMMAFVDQIAKYQCRRLSEQRADGPDLGWSLLTADQMDVTAASDVFASPSESVDNSSFDAAGVSEARGRQKKNKKKTDAAGVKTKLGHDGPVSPASSPAAHKKKRRKASAVNDDAPTHKAQDKASSRPNEKSRSKRPSRGSSSDQSGSADSRDRHKRASRTTASSNSSSSRASQADAALVSESAAALPPIHERACSGNYSRLGSREFLDPPLPTALNRRLPSIPMLTSKELQDQTWFCGLCTRTEAENLLSCCDDGTLLVRESMHGGFVVSVVWRSNPGPLGAYTHVKVKKFPTSGYGLIDRDSFITIQELVSYYVRTSHLFAMRFWSDVEPKDAPLLSLFKGFKGQPRQTESKPNARPPKPPLPSGDDLALNREVAAAQLGLPVPSIPPRSRGASPKQVDAPSCFGGSGLADDRSARQQAKASQLPLDPVQRVMAMEDDDDDAPPKQRRTTYEHPVAIMQVANEAGLLEHQESGNEAAVSQKPDSEQQPDETQPAKQDAEYVPRNMLPGPEADRLYTARRGSGNLLDGLCIHDVEEPLNVAQHAISNRDAMNME